jgi:hypothetical protein
VVTDRIVLTIPAREQLRSVATLVVGGVGSRLELPYERMDDLQLALLSALDATDGGEVSLEVDAGDEALVIAVGPVRAGSSEDAGLARVLSPLVDELRFESRAGSEWLSLTVASRA